MDVKKRVRLIIVVPFDVGSFVVNGSSAAIIASAMNSAYRWTDQPRRRTSSSYSSGELYVHRMSVAAASVMPGRRLSAFQQRLRVVGHARQPRGIHLLL